MNVENVTTWIKALRSGKYKQTRVNLRDERGYCCLGVAAVAAGIPIGAGAGPYADVCEWLGIRDNHTAATDMWKFIRLNDQEKLSFSEIADYAEEQLTKQVLAAEATTDGVAEGFTT